MKTPLLIKWIGVLNIFVALITAGTASARGYDEIRCLAHGKAQEMTLYGSLLDNLSVVSSHNSDGDGGANANEVNAITLGIPRQAGRHDESATANDDIVFKFVADTGKKKSRFNDGCWTGESGKFIRSVDVVKISRLASQHLRLKIGERLKLNCEYQKITPIDERCVPTTEP